jgi:hypothetical protein
MRCAAPHFIDKTRQVQPCSRLTFDRGLFHLASKATKTIFLAGQVLCRVVWRRQASIGDALGQVFLGLFSSRVSEAGTRLN